MHFVGILVLLIKNICFFGLVGRNRVIHVVYELPRRVVLNRSTRK